MPRAMPTPTDSASVTSYTLTEADKALIARALREASIHHTDPFNLSFVCKGRTNSRPLRRIKTRPVAAASLNDEGARSGPFIVYRRS